MFGCLAVYVGARIVLIPRDRRDSVAVESALAALKEASLKEGVNLMPLIVEASRAYVTMGEMCDALRETWGIWRETPVF
jgi:methylmalonyl-CoA mutase N-terminal domain/subunit